MLRVIKPRNARSKRALEAREPKEVEDPRTAIFVKGTSIGEVLNGTMKELMALKRPHAISFSKKNVIRPFEDASSLEFWSNKNDASMFVVAQSTKKRPDGLTFVRMFNGKVLDVCEVGVEKFVSMNEFKTKKSTPGHRPLIHFASDLFDTHPRFMQLKSLLLDFFGSEVLEGIHLSGIEHVMSVQLAPTPDGLTNAASLDVSGSASTGDERNLPKVHIRTYTISAVASGTKIPRIELVPMGPMFDLTLRRHQPPDPDLLKAALKRPKLKKQDVEKGLGKRKKNVEVDDMGDVRGRLHVGKQDLGKLQAKRMKGLRDVSEGVEERSGKRKKMES